MGRREGLRRAAELAPEGIQAIAVDGWAVDYVALGYDGQPLADPYCYRDLRTVAAEQYLHRHIAPEKMRGITAITSMRINTLYQLHADRLTNCRPALAGSICRSTCCTGWVGVRLLRRPTRRTRSWWMWTSRCGRRDFYRGRSGISQAPELVAPGTDLGQVRGMLTTLDA